MMVSAPRHRRSIVRTLLLVQLIASAWLADVAIAGLATATPYPVVDTRQTASYDTSGPDPATDSDGYTTANEPAWGIFPLNPQDLKGLPATIATGLYLLSMLLAGAFIARTRDGK